MAGGTRRGHSAHSRNCGERAHQVSVTTPVERGDDALTPDCQRETADGISAILIAMIRTRYDTADLATAAQASDLLWGAAAATGTPLGALANAVVVELVSAEHSVHDCCAMPDTPEARAAGVCIDPSPAGDGLLLSWKPHDHVPAAEQLRKIKRYELAGRLLCGGFTVRTTSEATAFMVLPQRPTWFQRVVNFVHGCCLRLRAVLTR